MATTQSISRVLGLACALASTRALSRSRIFEQVEGYPVGGRNDSADRRLYEDLCLLASAGFCIDRNEVGKVSATWPHVVRPDVELADSIFEAASNVGTAYFLEDPLRVAVYKLTSRLLPRLDGELSRAHVCNDAAKYARGAMRSVTTAREAPTGVAGQWVRVHRVLVGAGPALAVAAGRRGRARVAHFDEIAARCGRVSGEPFAVRSRLAVDAMALPPVADSVDPARCPVFSEAISRAWTIAAALRCGDVFCDEDMRLLAGDNSSRTARDITALTLTGCGAGEYLLYVEKTGDAYNVDTEVHSDQLARPWPLSSLEAQSVYGALALSGDRRAAASLELLCGIPNRIEYLDATRARDRALEAVA